jgi:hypothetical protein
MAMAELVRALVLDRSFRKKSGKILAETCITVLTYLRIGINLASER